MIREVVLRMARTVGADKMVEGLADVVRPRMKGLDDAALKSFQSILTAGLGKHGATNNMLLRFTDTPLMMVSVLVLRCVA